MGYSTSKEQGKIMWIPMETTANPRIQESRDPVVNFDEFVY